ncbi:MAG: hypothetical protein QF793_01000 [Candidatus Peribacteraceae bacterium]|jgi:hypothetical protein|nr:hypothetical protein [bacterium]MDP6561482.1 hypothetical protein [Candidatus Peribacteraceae bacterium]|tara:strand:+ start:230 stop:1276 length:1047 start_codon:yes stop_codon:yes gene_type:complete
MQKPKPLPKNGAEFDTQHLHTFKHYVPWWFRQTQTSQEEFTVTDFVADIRGRLERSIKRQNKEMGRIFKDRRIFSRSFAYSTAQYSASWIKPGCGMGVYEERMYSAVDMMRKSRRFAITQGDPLYGGDYGTLSSDRNTGQSLYLNDLTVPEKELVAWLHDTGNMSAVLSDQELNRYTQVDSSLQCISYAVDLRKKIWEIIDCQDNNGFDQQWRGECVDMCIDQLLTMAEDRQQSTIDDLVGEQTSGKVHSMGAQEVIDTYIRPNMHEKEKAVQSLSLLEQMFAVASEEKDIDRIIMLVEVWNEILRTHDIASNQRPTGGVAGLTIKCAAENIQGIKEWLGPKPEKRSS